eukprot:m.304090 g.304090  ORF g.304090 m.304090 type:complete len:700 (+) comp40844_c0_seq33:2686-4785(+)
MVATDASGSGLGAVLFQIGERKQEVVVAYASRTLSKAERAYSVIEREGLALVWAVTHFRIYLWGRPFQLITDHCPLKWLKTVRDPTGRVARWLLTLGEHSWSIVHKAGKEHGNADGLSRIPAVSGVDDQKDADDGSGRVEEMLPPTGPVKKTINIEEAAAMGLAPQWSKEDLMEMQRRDPVLKEVLVKLPGEKPKHAGLWSTDGGLVQCRQAWESLKLKDGVLYREVAIRSGSKARERDVLVVPEELKSEVLKQMHDGSGHLGIEKTREKVKELFWWPSYSSDVVKWVERCAPCEQKRKPVGKPRAPMQSIPVGRPMEMIGMDFVGPLPETEDGNKHLLVLSDYFTKWAEAFPLKDQKAVTTARVLMEQVVSRHGVPMVLHSDQGRNFEANVMKELCSLLGIEKVRTTPYHPQCDGLVERLNQTLIRMLSKVVDENQRDWDRKLPMALFGYRTARQSTTGQTPFELLYGRQPRLPIGAQIEGADAEEAGTTTEYGNEIQQQLAVMQEFSELRISEAQKKQREVYDESSREPSVIEKGDFVWLYSPEVGRGKSKKLSRPYKGPFVVVKKINVKIKKLKGGKVKRVHVNRVKPCYYNPEPPREEQEEHDEEYMPRRRRNDAGGGRGLDPYANQFVPEVDVDAGGIVIHEQPGEPPQEPEVPPPEAPDPGMEPVRAEGRPQRERHMPVHLREDYVLDDSDED